MATTIIAAHVKSFADFTLEQLGRHASVEEQGHLSLRAEQTLAAPLFPIDWPSGATDFVRCCTGSVDALANNQCLR